MASFGRYEVTGTLGRGGMGEVLLATDTRLGRQVALKQLPPELAGDRAARDALQREARALSRLAHPNLQTLFDVVHADGRDFLVCEYIPGETLQDRLERGPLPADELRDIARQLLAGLAAAHQAGVLHCDLKPANLMLQDGGRLRILDFGLARLRLDPDELTRARTAPADPGLAGTLSYLPPELLDGATPDERSDLYGAGATLYALWTGTPPFRAPTTAGTLAAIGRGGAEHPHARGADPDPVLAELVLALLSRDPGDRPASADEARQGIEGGAAPPAAPPPSRRAPRLLAGAGLVLLALAVWWLWPGGGGGGHERPRRLVVLPFEGIGAGADEALVDGFTEELMLVLGRLRPEALTVVGRSSSREAARLSGDAREACERLGVDYAIEGTVRAAGDRYRVGIQLVDAAQGIALWSGTLEEGSGGDLFDAQEGIARQVARSLEIQLLGPGEELPTPRVEPAAHRAWLRGRHHWNQRTGEGLRLALESFSRAAELDPGYALAHASLAETWVLLGDYAHASHDSALAQVERHAGAALEIDPACAPALAALGWAHTIFACHWDEAERDFRRAIEADPSYATAHQWYAEQLNYLARHDEALAHIRRALELDPLSPVVASMHSFLLLCAGELVEAEAQARIARDRAPGNGLTWVYWCFAMDALGRPGEALGEARAGLGDDPFQVGNALLAYLAARAGNPAPARQARARIEAGVRQGDGYEIALLSAGLQDGEGVYRGLRLAVEQGSVRALSCRIVPWFAPWQGSAEMEAIARAAGLPPAGEAGH